MPENYLLPTHGPEKRSMEQCDESETPGGDGVALSRPLEIPDGPIMRSDGHIDPQALKDSLEADPTLGLPVAPNDNFSRKLQAGPKILAHTRWDGHVITAAEMLVWEYINSFTEFNKPCFAAVATIAAKCHIDPRTARRALKQLELEERIIQNHNPGKPTLRYALVPRKYSDF